MSNEMLIKISKYSCNANDRRLFRMMRLLIIYHNHSKYSCTKKTRIRYKKAENSMRLLIKKNINKNYPKCSRWDIELIGNKSLHDVLINLNQVYLLTLQMNKKIEVEE